MLSLFEPETTMLEPMSADEAHECVEAIRNHMVNARAQLWELYTRKGWESLGYSSWRACAAQEFGLAKSQLYRQLEAAEIEQEISPQGEIGKIPEKHLRPLSSLPQGQRASVWQEALQTAPDGKMTELHVTSVVEKHKPPPEPVIEDRDIDPDTGEILDSAPDEPIWTPPAINRAYKNSSESNEWYTPRRIIDQAINVMGGIDLDPASSPEANQTIQASRIYTIEDNALVQPWFGRVWLNPPYGNDVEPFIDKLLSSIESGEVTEALLLVAARTDTAWFRKLRKYPRCFIWGRIKFINGETGEPGDPAGFPSMIVYMGPNFLTFATEFQSIGDIYTWWQQ